MPDPSSSAPLDDAATEANTVLLANCQRPEIMAKNRALCRDNGIQDGAHELRRLQHFVSQAIIKLLTKHNITQKDGRPYVSSSPKGFLQGPDMWLVDKGYYLSGWPRGLPRGSISIWPAYYTFALAAMFIKNTISLMPLGHASRNNQRTVPAHFKNGEPEAKGLVPAPMKTSTRVVPESGDRDKDNIDSDRDAEGSSESEQGSSSSVVPAPTASANRDKYRIEASSRWHASSSSSNRTATNSTSLRPLRIPDGRPKQYSYASGTRNTATIGSTLFPFPASVNINSADPRALEVLMSTTLGGTKKRQMPESEVSYPGVPSGATVNWIPPVSAARESKRAKRE